MGLEVQIPTAEQPLIALRFATSSPFLRADLCTLAANQVAGRSLGQDPHATLDVLKLSLRNVKRNSGTVGFEENDRPVPMSESNN